jgi:hypothetical protein
MVALLSERYHACRSKMKTIPLSKGKVAIVDQDMYDHIVSHRWKFYFADQGKSQDHRGYAKRAVDDARLHRLVLRFHGVDIPPGMDVDHKNGDRLDNRFENLQLLSRRENLLKKKRNYVNETGYRGVIVRRDGRSSGTRYRAYVNHEGRTYYNGMHGTAEEAARAHDELAKQLQGDLANLNFP